LYYILSIQITRKARGFRVKGFIEFEGDKRMFVKNEISIYDFACALSEVADTVSPILNNHHKRVAYIALNIALEMKLSNEEIQDIAIASMLHDIGAFSTAERLRILNVDWCEDGMDQHTLMGYNLLKGFEPLAKVATLIKYHHTSYNQSDPNIPIGSNIIHLADRVVALFDDRREILEQLPEVLEKIALKHYRFSPEVFVAFTRLLKLEYVWIEAFASSFNAVMNKRVRFSKGIIELETLRDFAQIVAHIIDFRSKFTATHSTGVAAVARELAVISGFSPRECKLMEITGLLHDLGKLAVPNDILEKPDALSNAEFSIIRKHTYYTYAVLSKVSSLEDIAAWAAFHHERPDGTGYPFHVKDEDFPRLARMMAVADIFTALTEDRPYRAAMDREKAVKILYNTDNSGCVDKSIVELADRNFSRINDARIKAQQEAQQEYNALSCVMQE
jgi:HD-GYP domain-containing protein (c-di-GMP phosphodiesterase class II)